LFFILKGVCILFKETLDLFRMANVRAAETGLKMLVYIGPRMPNMKHGPRIKVSKKYGDKVSNDFFSISFNDKKEIELVHRNTGEISREDVEQVVSFVESNLDTLLDLWYDKIDSTDAVLKLNKV
jgi:hypothetical protein